MRTGRVESNGAIEAIHRGTMVLVDVQNSRIANIERRTRLMTCNGQRGGSNGIVRTICGRS